jgi:SAM-dependent methyltransferase
MDSIYTSGQYLEATETWHAEDSQWKADCIGKLIWRNRLQPQRIAEIGCGVGGILEELAKQDQLKDVSFSGHDIAPKAIELARRRENSRLRFFCQDLLSEENQERVDILLVIDVLEHVTDYLGFLQKCRTKAEYKIYHIPLDIHVSSVLRNNLIQDRYTVGHIHYFTADSAVAALKDTGHEILDQIYTSGAFGLFKQHPSFKKAVANIPRWLVSKLSVPLTAKIFGGYSLLVLAK